MVILITLSELDEGDFDTEISSLSLQHYTHFGTYQCHPLTLILIKYGWIKPYCTLPTTVLYFTLLSLY